MAPGPNVHSDDDHVSLKLGISGRGLLSNNMQGIAAAVAELTIGVRQSLAKSALNRGLRHGDGGADKTCARRRLASNRMLKRMMRER